MVATPSTMLPLGTPAPAFELPEPLTGKTVRLADFDDAEALVVAFICNHCPYVIHLKEALVTFARDLAPEGVSMVAISANDAEAYPQDGPEKMAEEARAYGYPFPYLYDETQEVAKAYGAACTPDFYLFGRDRKLVYRGQFDATRPDHRTAPDTPDRGAEPTGEDLRTAVRLLLDGKEVPAEGQRPSLGCNIKWKPENTG
ncbi:MAG: thioredoxin family protein [Opitutales bacterium]